MSCKREPVFYAEDEGGFLRRWFPPKSLNPTGAKLSKGLGVREAARITGVSHATVSRINNGKSTSLDVAQKMLPVLDECPCCGKPVETKP